jgi:hypothetical protein
VTLTVYIAGRYSRRPELLAVAQLLRAQGTIVTSRWLDGRHDKVPPVDCAKDDLEDIDAAHGLLSFTEDNVGYMSGGRHVEFGYALARGKWLWIVGPFENVFHHLGRVRQFGSVSDWSNYMGESMATPAAGPVLDDVLTTLRRPSGDVTRRRSPDGSDRLPSYRSTKAPGRR